jgi:hypothetical protein
MKTKLKGLINYHFWLYPKMQIEDLYKLIYQSVMGPWHLLQDEREAFQSLKNQIEKGIGKERELFVNIGLENDLVRVNLNVYKEKTGDAHRLFSAMEKTAEIIKPDKSKLQNVWTTVGEMFASGEICFLDYGLWRELTDLLIQNDFPYISHSKIYRKNYFPLYRIVLKGLLSPYIHNQELDRMV